eukprot:SAG11_NODE_13250_length_663_cov_0.847518_2_plen_30_part_01
MIVSVHTMLGLAAQLEPCTTRAITRYMWLL